MTKFEYLGHRINEDIKDDDNDDISKKMNGWMSCSDNFVNTCEEVDVIFQYSIPFYLQTPDSKQYK